MHAHHPLCSTGLHRSSSGAGVVEATSGDTELSDKVCEIVAALASFKSDFLKHCGLSESGDKKGKRKDKITMCRHTYSTLFAHCNIQS